MSFTCLIDLLSTVFLCTKNSSPTRKPIKALTKGKCITLYTVHMTFRDFMLENFGVEPVSTFWLDFSIADKFGKQAVQDTFNRAFAEWRSNYKYLAELVIVLNQKSWQLYNSNVILAKLYADLYHHADAYACENLHGDEMDYYFNLTD